MANSSQVGRDVWLTDAQVRNHARARVEVIQALAGRARILWELATGNVPVDGPPASGYNPQGLVGCDLSGPPWGSIHRHVIATMGGIKPDSATFSSRPATYFPLTGLSAPHLRSVTWRVWNRPFETLPETGVAPLSRARLLVSGYSSSATNPTITVYGRTNDERASEAMSESFTQTTGATEESFTLTSSFFLRLKPGANTIILTFASDTSSATYTITKLMLYHGVKRSH